MDNFGFIHGELDTKILILYVLRRLPRPVDAQTLSDLCSFDNGVSWFDYSECLADLVDTGHVERLSGERYLITDKGRTNGEAAETSIPYSVRMKADRLHGAGRRQDAARRDDRRRTRALPRRGRNRAPEALRRQGRGHVAEPAVARRGGRRGHGARLPRRRGGHLPKDNRNSYR